MTSYGKNIFETKLSYCPKYEQTKCFFEICYQKLDIFHETELKRSQNCKTVIENTPF